MSLRAKQVMILNTLNLTPTLPNPTLTQTPILTLHHERLPPDFHLQVETQVSNNPVPTGVVSLTKLSSQYSEL